MKRSLFPIFIAFVAAACTGAGSETQTPLDRAQAAIDRGDYSRAQQICDTLASARNLPVGQLCRLSVLLMDLGDRSGSEDVNTVLAARCLGEAYCRDSDSTVAVINGLPTEERGQVMILMQLNEAQRRATGGDTLIIPADSIPDNEI